MRKTNKAKESSLSRCSNLQQLVNRMVVLAKCHWLLDQKIDFIRSFYFKKNVRLFAKKWITREPLLPCTSIALWIFCNPLHSDEQSFIFSLFPIIIYSFLSYKFYRNWRLVIHFTFLSFYIFVQKKTRTNVVCAVSRQNRSSESK